MGTFTEVIKRRNYILDSIHVTDKCGGFPGGSVLKNLSTDVGDAEDMGSVPGSGRSPAGRNGNPLQYSCLENLMDRGTSRATVQGLQRVGHDLATEHACLGKYGGSIIDCARRHSK